MTKVEIKTMGLPLKLRLCILLIQEIKIS